MLRTSRKPVALAPEQRRVVVAVAVAQVALLSLTASLNYVLPAVVAEFQASDQQEAICREMSNVASLLVVFVAGILGQRLGERRVLIASATIFAAGSLIVVVAPSMNVVTLGLLIASSGKAVLSVVALAFLAASIRDRDGRATAFATISSVVPVAYLVMPLVAGGIVSHIGWRWVSVTWVVCGLISMAAIARFLPRDGVAQGSGEMWTPALAGFVLAAGVQFISRLSDSGMNSLTAFIGIACGVALIALIAVYRHLQSPTLTVAPLRHGGFLLLLLIVVLFSFTNLYYYNTLLYQISYGYSAFGAAIIMIPAQCGSILGAVVARKLIQTRGIDVTGTLMIVMVGVAMLLATTVQVGSPLIWPMILVSSYAVATVAAMVALTNAVMNLAEPGDEGVTSSYKTASSNIGGVLGVAIFTVVVSVVGTSVMRAEMASSGQSVDPQAAWSILEGTSPQDASDLYGIPVDEANAIDQEDTAAFVAAYRAQAAVGGVLALGTALLFFVVRRRHARAGARRSPASESR